MPQASVMDKAGPRAYRPAMFRLLAILVSAFTLAFVSFTASAHETGMAVSRDFGSAMQAMQHAAPEKASCVDEGTCSTEAGLCDLVCLGSVVFLPPRLMSAGVIVQRRTYLRTPGAVLVETLRVPEDRPPITHLL